MTIDTRAILQEKYKSYVYLKTTPSDEKENLTAGTESFSEVKKKKKKKFALVHRCFYHYAFPARPTVFPVRVLGVSLLTDFTSTGHGSLCVSSRDTVEEEP